jgi:hypothetical protein
VYFWTIGTLYVYQFVADGYDTIDGIVVLFFWMPLVWRGLAVYIKKWTDGCRKLAWGSKSHAKAGGIDKHVAFVSGLQAAVA